MDCSNYGSSIGSSISGGGVAFFASTYEFLSSRYLHAFCPYFEKHPSSHSFELQAWRKPHRISLDTIRAWIETCDLFHADHCQFPGDRSQLGRPLCSLTFSGNASSQRMTSLTLHYLT